MYGEECFFTFDNFITKESWFKMTMCLAMLSTNAIGYITFGLISLIWILWVLGKDPRLPSLDNLPKDMKGSKPKNDKSVRRLIIHEKSVSTKDNVRVNIKGEATYNVLVDPYDIQPTASGFAGQTPIEIDNVVVATVVGYVRAIICNLDVNSLVKEDNTLGRRIIHESFDEMSRMGIKILSIDVQEITDGFGAFHIAQVTGKDGKLLHVRSDGTLAY